MWKNLLCSTHGRLSPYSLVAIERKNFDANRNRSWNCVSIRWLPRCVRNYRRTIRILSRRYHENAQSLDVDPCDRIHWKGLREQAECCIARVRKYVPWYHRCLYVQGYEQTRAAVYSKLPFMKLNFMVCGIRLYPACWILPVNELPSHPHYSFSIGTDRSCIDRDH